MTAEEEREQRLKLLDDHIGRALADTRQLLALRLEKLRGTGAL